MFETVFAVVWLFGLVVVTCMALRLALRLAVGVSVLVVEALEAPAMWRRRPRGQRSATIRGTRRAVAFKSPTVVRSLETGSAGRDVALAARR